MSQPAEKPESRFVACSLRDQPDNPGVPVERVRLVGDGWYIEVCKANEHSIQILCNGDKLGAGEMRIAPSMGNCVYVSCNAAEGAAAHAQALSLFRSWQDRERGKQRRTKRRQRWT